METVGRGFCRRLFLSQGAGLVPSFASGNRRLEVGRERPDQRVVVCWRDKMEFHLIVDEELECPPARPNAGPITNLLCYDYFPVATNS
jgi:hypothetical protein